MAVQGAFPESGHNAHPVSVQDLSRLLNGDNKAEVQPLFHATVVLESKRESNLKVCFGRLPVACISCDCPSCSFVFCADFLSLYFPVASCHLLPVW